MHLDRSHPHLVSGGQNAELVSDPDLGAHRGAGDDGTVSFNYKRAIERKTEDSGRAAGLEAVELTDHLGAERVDAGAGYRRDRNDRRTGQRGAVGEQLDLVADIAEPRRIGKVSLGDDEDAAAGAEQMEDVEM